VRSTIRKIDPMLAFADLNRVWVSAKGKEKATRNPGKRRRVAGLSASWLVLRIKGSRDDGMFV
jgi:hypothetical protein